MARVDLGSSAEELTRAWRAAPEAQRSDFLDDLLMEALLTDALARKRRTWLHSRRAWWAAAAAAALLVIAGAMGWRLWSQTRYPRPELTGDCVVTTPDGSVVGAADIRRGDRLTAGKEGAKFRLKGRCELTLEAASRIVWKGREKEEVFDLDEGRMRSVVEPKQGTFTVVTPRGSLKALGTDFVTEVRYETLEKEDAKMKVHRLAVVSVMVAAGAVACVFDNYTGVLSAGMTRTFAAEAQRQGGELSGTVVGVEPVKAEAVVRLALTVTTEGGEQATFIVGPANAQAYATVGALKAGDKVRLAWVPEGGDQKWIRVIHKLDGTRDAEKARQREGGDNVAPREGGDRK